VLGSGRSLSDRLEWEVMVRMQRRIRSVDQKVILCGASLPNLK